MKNLAVFDFDHTILDDNSDTAILELVNKDEIPQEIKNIQFTNGWTTFMQAIFTYLYEKNITPEQIINHIRSLPPVCGMVELVNYLKSKLTYDLILISDSNSIFIQVWLDKHKLEQCFTQIYTNPAEVVGGMFKIYPYQTQNTCKLSTPNMCKGNILEEFIRDQEKKSTYYNSILYIGDGVNDFCPVLRLNQRDLVCVRNKYRLLDLVERTKSGKYLDNTGKPHNIKSQVLIWDTADDISKYLTSKS